MNSIIRKGLMLAGLAAAPAFSASIDAITGHWKLVKFTCDGKVEKSIKAVDLHLTTNTLAMEGSVSFDEAESHLSIKAASVALIRGADHSRLWIQTTGSLMRMENGELVTDTDNANKVEVTHYSLSPDGSALKMSSSSSENGCKNTVMNFVRK